MQVAKYFRAGFFGETRMVRNPRLFYRTAALALFLLGLLCGIYLAFPEEVLRQRLVYELEARFPIRVELAKAGLRPLLTLTGEKGGLRYLDRHETVGSVERFRFSPFWAGIITGDPGVKGEFFGADGELALRWQRSGLLAMSATALPIDIPLPSGSGMRFVGIITTGQVRTAAPLQSASRSLIDLSFEQAALQGLEALTRDAAGLRLGKMSLRMSGQGTLFFIDSLEATGGDVVVSGKGTVTLVKENPQNSQLNLNLSVRAGNQKDPTLANFIQLAGTPLSDGSRNLHLTGTFANPVIR
jgi:type II secretion system protein N